MKIREFTKEYTAGNPITFRHVLSETNEFFAEAVKLNKNGIKEEFGDIFLFLQLWLYWRFKVNGELWKIAADSIKKFMARKQVWNKIYAYVGLPENVSGYVGNYKKIEKVIGHLQKLGIDKERAEEAYRKIVL